MHHEVKLVDIATQKVFFDKLTYIYLEMPKFRKTEQELVTLLDKWLYAIKNLATLMERPKALQEAVFKRLFEQAEIAAFNRDELYDYRESQKDFWDLNSAIETAEKKGRAEGRAEGLAEGLAEGEKKGEKKGIIKTAKNMKAEGLPASLIAKMTGLPEEEIDKL